MAGGATTASVSGGRRRLARLAAALAGLPLFAGCGAREPAAAAGGHPPVVVQLDWVAEPEHGGFYTAEALGWFAAEGLRVELLQGGPNAHSLNKVATGVAQLGQADSTNVLLAIANGAPLLNVAAIFQHDPSVLMMHESNPVERWEDLDGRLIMARPEWAFLPYLRRKYGIGFEIVAQNFDLGRLVADPSFIQQGFYIAEPYFVQEKGVRLKFLYAWDAGFDAYTTLFTNRAFARDHPETLRAVLRVLHRAYRHYVEVDPAPAHEIMLRINPKVTPAYLDWSRRMIIDAALDRRDGSDYLAITAERYRNQLAQLVDLGVLAPDALTVERVMDASFLPARVE